MKEQNYLDKIPCRSSLIRWTADEDAMVTLEIENRGIFNRIAQKLLKKPPVTYVHLDKSGSFVWSLIDGEKNIAALAEKVDAHFGEESYPLYERLVKYFCILDSYHFINWN